MAGQRHDRMAGWTGRRRGLAASGSAQPATGALACVWGPRACGPYRFSTTTTRAEVLGRHVTSQQTRLFMKFRPQHLQRVAATAGLRERTARRIETIVVPPPKPSRPAPPKFD